VIEFFFRPKVPFSSSTSNVTLPVGVFFELLSKNGTKAKLTKMTEAQAQPDFSLNSGCQSLSANPSSELKKVERRSMQHHWCKSKI
jgi:hypothetical protein